VTTTHRGRPRGRLGDVLAAADFSPGAAEALARAVRLPMRRGSTLTILHVLPPGLDRKTSARARAEAKEALAEAAALARRAAPGGVRLVTRLAEGVPFVEIVRRARRDRADLVVLGRHGHRGFEELLLGSTAERVVRRSDTSVLVVGAKPAGGYARPLGAIDLSPASRAVVEGALRVSEPSVRSLAVVHAYEAVPESALRRVVLSPADIRRAQDRASRGAHRAVGRFLHAGQHREVQPRIIVRPGDARRVILDVAAQRRPDLLAVGSHGRTGIPYILLGSVAAAIVRAAPCDVLVARPRRRRAAHP
jgi:nucleotide-binding universal stress UspA family protein